MPVQAMNMFSSTLATLFRGSDCWLFSLDGRRHNQLASGWQHVAGMMQQLAHPPTAQLPAPGQAAPRPAGLLVAPQSAN